MSEQKILWTFIVRGAEAIHLAAPMSPPLEHPGGGMTVWKTILTPKEAEEVRKTIEELGGSAQLLTSRQTEEQKREREALLAVQDPDATFHTEKCLACYFFDPLSVNKCGLKDWQREVVSVSMEHPKAKEDHASCPLLQTE